MAELTDSQLLAELQDIEDDQTHDNGSEEAKAKEDKEQNLSGAVEDATAKAPVLANVQPTDKSAAASTTVSKGADDNAENACKTSHEGALTQPSTLPAKKRGLTMVKKGGNNAKPPAGPGLPTDEAQLEAPKKAIPPRIVPQDNDTTAVPSESEAGSHNKAEKQQADAPKSAPKQPKRVAAKAPVKTVVAPAKLPKKSAEKEESPGQAKVKRAKNAYMFFITEKRASVKAENPDLSFTDLTKKLGEMWKSLTDDEKAPFEELAKNDKDRAAKERKEVPLSTEKRKAKQPTKTKTSRAKTAYQLFCDEERGKVKAANPDATFGAITSLLAAAWKHTSDADRARFVKMHEDLKASVENAAEPAQNEAQPSEAMPSAEADDQEETGNADMNMKSDDHKQEADAKHPVPKSKRKRETRAATGDNEMAASDAAEKEQEKESDEDEESIEAEMMNVDWEAHPAEYIVGETFHSKYVVKRKGLDFSACGLVDAKACKRQRLAGPSKDEAAPCPVSIQLLDEWDAFTRGFRCAVHAHSDAGELDLDDLNQDSPLEMCSWLGIMREPDFPLSKAVKNKDATIKVPMLALSMAVQRVANVSRSEMQAVLEQECSQRIKAEEALADKVKEVEQLQATLKKHGLTTGADDVAIAAAEE